MAPGPTLLRADGEPTAPALIEAASARVWTYSEVQTAAAEIARKLDLPRKGLIFLLCRNDSATVLGYLGALSAGHAVALLDADGNADARQMLLETYRPDYVLGAASSAAALGPAYGTPGPDGSNLAVARREQLEPHDIHPRLALLLSTSGTTGSPKFVRLAGESVLANAESVRQYLQIGPAERAVSSLPLHYSYGLSILNSHLLAGGSVLLTNESVLRPEFWNAFSAHGCTSFAGVPFTYQMLDRLGFDRLRTPTLRTMTQAGGRMDNRLILKFHDIMRARGGRLVVMYGQTEATARIAYLPEHHLPDKVGCVGIAIPGTMLSLERDGVEIKEPGVDGEVVLRGPNVMMGYATTRTDLVKGDELGGTLRTGDIGRFDKDGLLMITGRVNRFSKLFGFRISLDEVEAAMSRHGPTAVTGTDEKIVIWCEHGDAAAHDDYRKELAVRYKLPVTGFEFRRIEQIPRTASDKPDYKRLVGGS